MDLWVNLACGLFWYGPQAKNGFYKSENKTKQRRICSRDHMTNSLTYYLVLYRNSLYTCAIGECLQNKHFPRYKVWPVVIVNKFEKLD